MKRIILLFLALLLISALLIPTAAAADDEPLVIDNAGLLTSVEAQALQESAEALSARHGVKFVILTTQNMDGQDPRDYANDYYDHHFTLKGAPDGILLLYAIEEGDLYISTCGSMIEMADEDVVDDILYGIVGDIRRQDYSTAFSRFLTFAEDAIEEYPERVEAQKQLEEAARQREKEERQRRLKRSFIIAPIIGLLVGFLPVSLSKSSLTTVRPQDGASEYFGPEDRRMTVTRDIFLYTNTTTRVIQEHRDSGGGGGSSSGGSHSTHTSSSGVTHGGHGIKV